MWGSRRVVALLLCVSAGARAWRRVCVNSAVRLPPKADSLPRNPAPDAWVKVEVEGSEICRTPYISNNINPIWKHCCDIPDELAFSHVWFSVFDSDTLASEGDYLGSAGFSMASSAGNVQLALEGSDVPGDMTGRPSLLNVFVTDAPPPPAPPALPPSPAPPPAQRWLCVMEAEGLPQADFWPNMGDDIKPDVWAKVEIADEPKDKSGWRHFADNFRMKMANDLEAMGGEIQMLGEEIFKTTGSGGRCHTSTVYNSHEPRWQHCCDLSAASEGQMYVIALFDEDIAYSYSDYLGFAAIPVSSANGKHTLPVKEGYSKGTLTVELHNQPNDNGTSAGIPLTNFGVDCWEQCGHTGGRCDFCGSMGSCCRDGYGEVGCPVLGWHIVNRKAAPAGSCGDERHCCVFMDSVERASREGRVAFSGEAGVHWDTAYVHQMLREEKPSSSAILSEPAAAIVSRLRQSTIATPTLFVLGVGAVMAVIGLALPRKLSPASNDPVGTTALI